MLSNKSKRYLFILTVFFFGLSNFIHTYAQNTRLFKKNYDIAKALILESYYIDALSMFKDLDSLSPNNPNIQYFLGLCYLQTRSEKSKAIPYFENAAKKISSNYMGTYRDRCAPFTTYYYLGLAYHYNYNFDLAIESYDKYKKCINSGTYFVDSGEPEDEDEINKLITRSNYAKSLFNKPLNVKIENIGDSINTEYPDYAPVVTQDEKTMFFTSRRPENIGGEKDDLGFYYEDIYYSTYDSIRNYWRKAQNIGSEINTNKHEATMSISFDNKKLFIYEDLYGNGDIFVSNSLEDNKWSEPEILTEPVNKKSWETHASLAPDGKTLYFVSDRKKGIGGKDIWQSTLDPEKGWTKPINLGKNINTESDEESPFILSDGVTLFFSSKGRNTMGGFDIFMSKKDDNGNWSKAINLGYPVNTTNDDIFFCPVKDGCVAYYSAVREGGKGDLDIYKISILNNKNSNLISFFNNELQDSLFPEAKTNIAANIADTTKEETENNFTDSPVIIEKTPEPNVVENVKKEVIEKTLISSTSSETSQKNNLEEQICFTVQVGAGKMNPKYFSKINKDLRIIDCKDGMRRFVTKEFSVLSEAIDYKMKLKKAGFKDLWLRRCISDNLIETNNVIVLNNINLNDNNTKVDDVSKNELDKIYDLFIKYPELKAKIDIQTIKTNSGVTSNRKIVKAIYNYLISKGIAKKRIIIIEPENHNKYLTKKYNIEFVVLNR